MLQGLVGVPWGEGAKFRVTLTFCLENLVYGYAAYEDRGKGRWEEQAKGWVRIKKRPLTVRLR